MRPLQQQLISLAQRKEITYKDIALIILSKDGLKPLSSVGFCSSPGLVKILREYEIPFMVRDGRVYIGNLARDCRDDFHDGADFGFPACCSSVFLDHVAWFFSRSSKASFSSLSPYIFHVPCSDKCEETQKLAQRYMVHIKEKYPVVAEQMEKIA